MLGTLHRGDHVRFNATMHSMGDNSHLHHLHLKGIERIDGHRDVEAHASTGGRYKVRIEPHDGKDHSHDEPTTESFVLHDGEDEDLEEGAASADEKGKVTT